MLNPFKLLAVYSDLNKMQAVTEEKVSMPTKVTQIVTLVVTLFGTLGVPQLASNWLPSHLTAYSILVAVALILHACFPSIFGATSQQDQDAVKGSSSGPAVKNLIILLVFLLFASAVMAQTATPAPAPAPASGVQNVYAAGVSYGVGATPPVAGTALYAHQIPTNSGTYAFTVVDLLPNTQSPFTVTTSIGAGVAQKVFSIGSVPIFVPTSAGISISGSNTGWAWTTGALADVKIKGNWHALFGGRVIKSSVSNGSGYQPNLSAMVAWEQ